MLLVSTSTGTPGQCFGTAKCHMVSRIRAHFFLCFFPVSIESLSQLFLSPAFFFPAHFSFLFFSTVFPSLFIFLHHFFLYILQPPYFSFSPVFFSTFLPSSLLSFLPSFRHSFIPTCPSVYSQALQTSIIVS